MSAKESFEKEREQILAALPDKVKDMFGQIGFAKLDADDDPVETGNGTYPVLILSPYDVPPRPVRDVYWFDIYSKNKRTKTLESLAYLCYHYGAEDPDDCYSFVEHEDFISFENGKKQGYDVVPPAIQKKIDGGVELSEEEEEIVRGIKEMQEDLKKEPAERKRGNEGFLERHEVELKEPPAKRQKKK